MLTRHSAAQEIPRLLYNPRVHYRVDKKLLKFWYPVLHS